MKGREHVNYFCDNSENKKGPAVQPGPFLFSVNSTAAKRGAIRGTLSREGAAPGHHRPCGRTPRPRPPIIMGKAGGRGRGVRGQEQKRCGEVGGRRAKGERQTQTLHGRRRGAGSWQARQTLQSRRGAGSGKAPPA